MRCNTGLSVFAYLKGMVSIIWHDCKDTDLQHRKCCEAYAYGAMIGIPFMNTRGFMMITGVMEPREMRSLILGVN